MLRADDFKYYVCSVIVLLSFLISVHFKFHERELNINKQTVVHVAS